MRGVAATLFAAALMFGATGVALAVSVAGPGTSPAAASGAPGSWQVQAQFPATSQPFGSVSCATTANCTAVAGSEVLGIPSIVTTTDGGATWTDQPAPSGIGPILGVSCASATTCIAVGSTQQQGGDGVAIGTTNGGATWTVRSMPLVGALSAISCPSTTTCTAVGTGVIVATTNGGTSWTTETIPAGASALTAISCASTTTCVAVGAGAVATTNGGTTWSTVASGEALQSVSCPVTSECMAAGESGTILTGITYFVTPIVLSGSCTLVGVCVGTANPPTNLTYGISCPSTSMCLAVGGGDISTASASGWTTQSAQISDLLAVSCSTTSYCTAAGSPTTLGGPAATVTTTDGGSTWSEHSEPNGVATFNAVSCPSTSVCTAVGTSLESVIQGEGGVGVVAQTTDGGASWTNQTSNLPSGVSDLVSVSCASATHCEAIGYPPSPGTAVIVGTTDGGATWQAQTAPSGFTTPYQIACSSETECTLVGAGSTSATAFGTTDGGATWQAETTPTGVSLNTVSCVPSTTSCTAGGLTASDTAAIVTSTDGGAIWTSETPPSGLFEIIAISCPSVTTCGAIGPAGTSVNGLADFISTTDGGSTWTSRSTFPASDFYTPTSPNMIACTSATNCTVVGDATVNDGPGVAVATNDGGSTWTEANTLPSIDYGGISCPAAGACTAVGTGPHYSSGIIIGQAPTTSMLLPNKGATVSGSTLVDATASSPVGLASVTFEVSGGSISDQVVGTGVATLYGYLAHWDTTDVPNGTYSLQSVATDTTAVSTTSAPISVTVDNAPPQTVVLVPSSGTTLSGQKAVLDASASAPGPIKSVQFVLSGGTLSNAVVATAVPTLYGYLAQWDSTTVPNGAYTLQSEVTEAGGTTALSPGTTVTVANALPTTQVLVPTSGATLSGQKAVLDASAAGPGHITSVQFLLSGGSLSNAVVATAVPTLYGYIALWDTTGVTNGTYTLQSEVTETGGTTATSPGITVTIAN